MLVLFGGVHLINEGFKESTLILPFNLPTGSNIPFSDITVANSLHDAFLKIHESTLAGVTQINRDRHYGFAGSRKPLNEKEIKLLGGYAFNRLEAPLNEYVLRHLKEPNIHPRSPMRVNIKGVYVDDVVSFIRRILGTEKIITGDVIVENDGFYLLVRVNSSGFVMSDKYPKTISGLGAAVKQIATKLQEIVDPINSIGYLCIRNEFPLAFKKLSSILSADKKLINQNKDLIVLTATFAYDDLYRSGEKEGALDVMRQGAVFLPKNKNMLMNYSLALAENNKFEEALSVIRKVKVTEENRILLDNFKAGILMKNKRMDLAIFYLEEILRYDPNNSIILNNYAAVLLELGRKEEAIVNLEKALAVNPENIEANWNLAVIRINMDKYKEALPLFEKIKDKWKLEADFWNNYGNALRATGKKDEALKSYKEALRINPNHLLAMKNLANHYYFFTHEYQKAALFYERIVAVDSDVQMFQNLGASYIYLERPQQAIDIYNQAIKRGIINEYVYFNLGLAYKRLKKYGEAIEAFEGAKRRNPYFIKSYSELIGGYSHLGNYAAAIKLITEAKRIDPAFKSPYYEDRSFQIQ